MARSQWLSAYLISISDRPQAGHRTFSSPSELPPGAAEQVGGGEHADARAGRAGAGVVAHTRGERVEADLVDGTCHGVMGLLVVAVVR